MTADPFARESNERTGGENCQFIGAYVPKHLADQLTLLSLLHGVSKSRLLRKMIADRLDEYGSVDNIVTVLVHRTRAEWQSRLARNRGVTEGWMSGDEVKQRLAEFAQEVRRGLRKRNLSLPLVERVVKRTLSGATGV